MSYTARDRAAKLLRRGIVQTGPRKTGRESITSLANTFEDGSHTHEYMHAPVLYENTYQLKPTDRFPVNLVAGIIRDVFERYLHGERYDPILACQMSKDLSEILKAKVKELDIGRYKFVSLVNIGQLLPQGMCIASRCLWDPVNDTCASYEYRNGSLYAVGVIYAVYQD